MPGSPCRTSKPPFPPTPICVPHLRAKEAQDSHLSHSWQTGEPNTPPLTREWGTAQEVACPHPRRQLHPSALVHPHEQGMRTRDKPPATAAPLCTRGEGGVQEQGMARHIHIYVPPPPHLRTSRTCDTGRRGARHVHPPSPGLHAGATCK
ncbi:hypothetical protein EDB89DRAFT_1987173 [Lactarius sanguifluus]|nr:hypothetical protein EDB89DRAFT_1987173 [Lactarius sanguifluus]